MGFDIECIVNIQSYPGEYFCPVCRTLVFPNEALQSLCTHLYCKPCLAHVANTTKACPYDGYLVTEADSKPLVESDKALADNIGNVKVHCQYRRSGCTWEGVLSESSSHCSGCTFGNSFVICNRCGIQIQNRQVHDHAQTCSGPPQAVDANNAALSTSQAHISGQALNQQANTISQTGSVAPTATPTLDPWFQQQYYQQSVGYNTYQQSYQQYYPYPQQLGQTYQQGQYNSQAYVQPQPVPLVPTQPQPSQQPQPQLHSQEKATQPSVALQGTNQLQSHVQSAAPHYQQVNPQQQLSSLQKQHPQGNAAFHSQTLPQQYAQMPGYQQPVHSTHPAVPSQNNPQSSQPQIRTQQHLQHQSLPHSQQYPPQINQPHVPNVHPHASHPANAVVTGHQSDQPPQQIPMGPPNQLVVHSHVATGSLPLHGNVTQQPFSSRPPLPHGLVANQQNPAVPTHMANNHPTQPQKLHTPPVSLVQHHPGIQPNQQSMPQQSQTFHASLQGQYSHFGQQQPFQSQLRPNGAHQVIQPGAHGYNLSQQSKPLVPGLTPQQPQSYGAQPMPAAQNKPAPLGSSHSSENSNFPKQGSDDLGQVQSQKDTNVRTDSVEPTAKNSVKQMKMENEVIDETRDGSGSSSLVIHDTDKEAMKGGASELAMQQTEKGEHTGDFSDNHSVGKSLGASAMEENIDTGVREESESLNQKEFTLNGETQTANFCAVDANGSDKFIDPLKSRSLHSSGFRPRTPGFSPTSLKSQRPDHLPPHAPISGFPGPGSTASYGRGRGMFGPLPRSFGLQLGAHQRPYGRNNGMPPNDREVLSGPSWSGDMSGPHNFPGPFRSLDGAGLGAFPVGGRMGEIAGAFPHHLHGRDSFGGNLSDFPGLGEPGFRSNDSRQGFADDILYSDNLCPFETSQPRKPLSVGWCRLCKTDCESVEGFDIHSQSREHQRIAMVIVKTIKQQNKKKSK
ncbi:hypothetical protein LIER_07932 [Lithospermum erythrorhizon]|uniref:RING-type domain-containing protein n=1 Tax=Lithospermum erythrorhizon TaxID=34254 RepID=A0AAV3PC22_LITER